MEFCKVNPALTFGTLSYVGKKEEVTEFDQTARRNKVVGVAVALLSSKQRETLEIVIPPRLNLSTFKYGEVVHVEDVRCVPVSEAAGDGAVKGWSIFATKLEKGAAVNG
ncbi:DUF961 family protein [Enterococcus sp. LJL90]